MRQVAAHDDAILVDIDAFFSVTSGNRLVGYDLFIDAVHPNIRAHQLIAAAVADAVRATGLPSPDVRWSPGTWFDPDPDSIVAANPELITKELLATGFACHAAGRLDCSLPTLRAAAQYTRNPATRAALEKALATFGMSLPSELPAPGQ